MSAKKIFLVILSFNTIAASKDTIANPSPLNQSNVILNAQMKNNKWTEQFPFVQVTTREIFEALWKKVGFHTRRKFKEQRAEKNPNRAARIFKMVDAAN